MFPVLFEFGFLKINTYGVCMAIGFFLAWKLVEALSQRKDLSNLLIFFIVSGVVGSRAAYVIEHWQNEFMQNPLQILRVDQGGLVFYGGLILSILVFFAWCFFKKEKPLALADLCCVAIPLAHACGRIGCFFYGCCWGRVSNSAFAVHYPKLSPAWCEQVNNGVLSSCASCSLGVLPSQLVEAFALFCLFALLLFLYKKYRTFTAGAYFIGYAIIRFFVEYLRGDPRAAVFCFSIGQTISIAMAILGCLFVFLSFRHKS